MGMVWKLCHNRFNQVCQMEHTENLQTQRSISPKWVAYLTYSYF